MGDNKRFIKRVLETGLDLGMLTADDVLHHVTIEILTQYLPPQVKARLLKASLESPAMTAQLIVDTVGFESLSEYVPIEVLWGCIAAGAARSLGQADASTSTARGNGSLRRRPTRQPPPPPGAGGRDSVPDIAAVAPPGSGGVAAAVPERKPNVTAPTAAAVGAAGATSRRSARAGTVDRALESLEMDDSVFSEKTRTGEPTEVFTQEKPSQPRTDWNDDDTNPGGTRRGGY